MIKGSGLNKSSLFRLYLIYSKLVKFLKYKVDSISTLESMRTFLKIIEN